MSPVERLLARAGFHLHNTFMRRLPATGQFAGEVASHAARWRQLELAEALPHLRYRLRREGLRRGLVAECFGLYAARLPAAPGAAVLSAALRLVHGAIVELPDAADRRCALALTALVRVLQGENVHLLSPVESAVKSLREQVAAQFSALGIPVGYVQRASPTAARRQAYRCPVVCATHREVAQDYLRDRIAAGPSGGPVSDALGSLGAAEERIMPGGPACALVDDADLALLDDANAPVAIATEIDQSGERLLYEQALELARSLAANDDFVIVEDCIALTEEAARRLERVVLPLGGSWLLRQRREELVTLALEALHLFRRDVDYRVQAGQVLFPPRPPQAEPVAGPDEEIQKLVEVKEGCRMSARKEVLARVSVPRFFSRYRVLGGACAHARGLEEEFWGLYGLKTSLARALPPALAPAYRLFATVENKHRALVAALHAAEAEGVAVTIAVRRPAEAQSVKAVLQSAGMDPGAARGIALLPTGYSVEESGGRRHILVAELPDTGRHVTRLQRDIGAERCTVMLSLDEDAVQAHLGTALAAMAAAALRGRVELPRAVAGWLGARALREAQRAGRSTRLELKAREQALEDLLAFSGQRN